MPHSAVWYVHPDSTLNSIQAGIGLCSTGDTVLVGPGTYVENINFNGMAITVMSEYGPDTTIIDGGSPSNPDTASVVCFVGGEDTASILHGFSIVNGSGTYDPVWAVFLGGGIYCRSSSPAVIGNMIHGNGCDYGGGIECEYSSSPIIRDNDIFNNTANLSAGGVDCYYYSSPHIEGNFIDGDTAGSGGGGIQCYTYCSPNIIDNNFTGNHAGSWGGAIRCGDYSSPFIKDNVITGNRAEVEGGGIECDNNANPTIRCNTITGNYANHGGGIQCDLNSSPIIDSCLISGNLYGHGIWCEQGSNPLIYHNNIIDNVGCAVFNLDAAILIDSENNWWGHAAGPYHPTGNPSGLGDTVSDHVDFDPWDTSPYPWGVEEYESLEPSVVELKVSPNPFRIATNIRYRITETYDEFSLRIYDIVGRRIRDLTNRVVTVGYQSSVTWDGTNEVCQRLPCGVYFLRLKAGDCVITEKMLLTR
jgi:hypothetical protein